MAISGNIKEGAGNEEALNGFEGEITMHLAYLLDDRRRDCGFSESRR
jgi:hypothetical protein